MRQKRSQSSSPRTQPTALSCDRQMLSLEILSTLSKTNKQAEFHSAAAAAAMKTPEAIFIHAQSDKQNTCNYRPSVNKKRTLQHCDSWLFATTKPKTEKKTKRFCHNSVDFFYKTRSQILRITSLSYNLHYSADLGSKKKIISRNLSPQMKTKKKKKKRELKY